MDKLVTSSVCNFPFNEAAFEELKSLPLCVKFPK
jgi:hypothetical protein